MARGLRRGLALAIVSSTCWLGASLLDACATGGEVAEGGGSDVTTPDSAAGDCGNTQTDPKNCGACNHKCDGGVCSQGNCQASCSGGTTQCGGSCVTLKTDPQHCGGCDAACASGDSCDGGTCIPSCTTQQVLCNDGGLFCADAQTDPNNCGTCGNACTGGWACQQARCLPVCTGGQTLCDIDGSADGGPPFCTNTQSDPSNCGGCDNPCNGGQYCDAGSCVTEPFTTCKTVNGLFWCYHAGKCGEACNTVCSYFGKTPVADASAWLNAQSTTTNCQAIAKAFNNTSTPSIASYTYACIEFQGGVGDDAGNMTGNILCSSYTGCPGMHLTNMDGLGSACTTSSWTSLCPCE